MRVFAISTLFLIATPGWAQPVFSDPISVYDKGGSDLVIIDINNDERQDFLIGPTLVAVNHLDEFSTFTVFPTGITLGSFTVDVADIDGQNGKDIVWAGGHTYMGLNLGLTTPAFEQIAVWERPGQIGVVAADLNGDGAIDLVATGSTGPFTITQWVAVLENEATSPTSFTINELPDADSFQHYAVVAEVNDDDRPDIVTTSDAYLAWRENLTTEPLTFSKMTITSSTYYFQEPVAADFDFDGDVDILVNSNAEMMWLENLDPSSPTFLRHVVYVDLAGDPTDKFSDFSIWRCKPLDFDLDEDMDIVLTGRQLLILENMGDDVSFTTHPLSVPQDVGVRTDLDVGDLNNDGYPDIVVSFTRESPANNSTVIYLNRFPSQLTQTSDWHVYK
jgi:hypothetical protein